MKTLFVWPVCNFSIWDVAHGYRSSLAKLIGNENIKDYYLNKHYAYHQKAIPEEMQNAISLAHKASETILLEALYFNADQVIIFSGLNVHPVALLLLKHCNIKTTVVFTESPYEDEHQAEWASCYPEVNLITNEIISAKRGWTYIPHAYDPEVHHPLSFDKNYESDVLMIGTGWANRIQMLEKVDWKGINLKIYGAWKISDNSPLKPFYSGLKLVDNTEIAKHYSSTKIVLNLHREHPEAQSMNPRAYEAAACGAFQICDKRKEVIETFGDTVPTVSNAQELEYEIRKALSNDHNRQMKAALARECIEGQTFNLRAKALLDTLH